MGEHSRLDRWMQRVMVHLPERFREDKMTYAFLFVVLVIGVLVIYAFISPYAHASIMFSVFAGFLLLLLFLLNGGMHLATAVHLGTGAGALMLLFAAWETGGILSPRLAWLLILPLTPFYLIGRRAGGFWTLVVWSMQGGIALASHYKWVPLFDLGEQHVLSSYMTFSLVTCVLIIVPLIYDRLHRQALATSRTYQQELQARRLELEHTLQIREHFIGTVSHELRTPMNAILGFNALLLSQLEGKPEARKVLNHTRQSADHLMTVINDILDYSQLQSGQLAIQDEVFELRQTVQHAFDLFGPRVSSLNLQYHLELDDNLPIWVKSDRHRLMQVLVNLLGNALKFTHDGSVVLRVQGDAGGVVFAVQDTGIGIAKDRQDQIFSRFSQAHDDIQSLYGGNGLGLSISRKLVQLLGGDMGMESTQGQGSRFWFRLPLEAQASPTQGKNQEPNELATKDRAWQFLVADDHPVNRLLVKQVLLNAWPHCTVLEADNGAKAVEIVRTQAVDLVLMDMVMPVMDGIDATCLIRQDAMDHVRQVPVLGLTANVNPLDLERFKAAGLNGVMLKPFEPAELCHRAEPLLLAKGAAA